MRLTAVVLVALTFTVGWAGGHHTSAHLTHAHGHRIGMVAREDQHEVTAGSPSELTTTTRPVTSRHPVNRLVNLTHLVVVVKAGRRTHAP